MSQASNSGPNMPLMLIPVSEALPAVQAHFERWASHDDVPPSPQELRELVDLTYRFVAVAELLRNYCGIPGATKRQLNMAPRSQCFETAAHVARFSRSESHIRQAGAWREATSAALARDGRTPTPEEDTLAQEMDRRIAVLEAGLAQIGALEPGSGDSASISAALKVLREAGEVVRELTKAKEFGLDRWDF